MADAEREALIEFLDLYRDIMVYKIEGLTEEHARFKPTPNGNSLLNLIVHLTGVERGWFELAIGGNEIDRDRAAEFGEIDTSVDEAIERYRTQCVRSNEIARAVPSLDDPCKAREPERSVRWVMLHMIEETARHAGHADITRELVDGAVGYSRHSRD